MDIDEQFGNKIKVKNTFLYKFIKILENSKLIYQSNKSW